jgi:hypothetical protein
MGAIHYSIGLTMTTNNNTIDTNLLRQIFSILIILFLGIVLIRELWFFLSAFLGAITFYVLMRERMFYLTERKGWRKSTAAWVLMLLSFFVILVPIGLLGNILYGKVSYVVTHSNEMIASLKQTVESIEDKIGYEIVNPDNINQLGPYLGKLLPKILGVTLNTITIIATMYFILYFMLVNGRRMEDNLYEYIPLKRWQCGINRAGGKNHGHFQHNWYSFDCPDPGSGGVSGLFNNRHCRTVFMVCSYLYHGHVTNCWCSTYLCAAFYNVVCPGRNRERYCNDHLGFWPDRLSG